MTVNAILARPFPPVTTMGEIMLAEEERAGRTPITPESLPKWVNISDWHPWPVLSIRDGELFIIAINAIRKGSLTRLLEGARGAGLSPVICAPMGPIMPDLVRKWGWVCTVTEDCEEWRPR